MAFYLLLLGASHLFRLSQRPTPSTAPKGGQIAVHPVVGLEKHAGLVELAVDSRKVGGPDSKSLPVLFLHGSPGSSRDFRQVMASLEGQFPLLAPDLPGFGSSARKVPDYSIRAHAGYVLQLLDALHIDRAHVVGFSMGGGVGIEIASQAPERVASLVLVSAIGVQEFELLGDYRLNHWIHGVQLAALWLLQEAVPHMGALDNVMLSVPYARNFFDTDQRPLRGLLAEFDEPMLIVHGRQDILVPVGAALEHHRLVPQSELQLLDSSHFFVFTEGEALASQLAAFFSRVEGGSALRRDQASAEAISLASAPFDPSTVPPLQSLALILAMVALAAGTLASEDLTCITAGLLVAAGRISFWPAAWACFLGIYFGDLMLYGAGRFLGRPALRRRPLRWFLRPEDVERSSRWFNRRGPLMILASRFLPGTRLATYFAAGLFQTRFWRFSFYFLVAAALWTPLLVALATWLGSETRQYLDALGRFAWIGAVGVFCLVLIVTRVGVPLFSYRGRRLLVGKFRRWSRWEYWPRWVFYSPVVAWILWLGVKYHRPTLFTAANPGIPHGGFVGESKMAILNGLQGSSEFVAASYLLSAALSPAERRFQALRFMEEQGLSFPAVLKPDQGERGSGVRILKDLLSLEEALEEAVSDQILQEYVGGVEVGIFYLRLPVEEGGAIFSVTEKILPEVLGDGVRTLEELILSDSGLLAMAPYYLKQRVDELDDIVPLGEIQRLVELGTHSRGAIFLDGGRLVTPQLESAFDSISSRFDGFYFGRYDVRVPSLGDLGKGLNFKILELNGVTSEATHIYDPSASLLDAYRVLFRQWQLAFEIGKQNASRGARVTPMAEFLRLLLPDLRPTSASTAQELE